VEVTKLNGKNDVVREAVETQRGRAYVITLNPHFALIRLKGQRAKSAYAISYETIYLKAAAIHAERVRREKAALRAGSGAPARRRKLRAW
jgi:hypothetical protein